MWILVLNKRTLLVISIFDKCSNDAFFFKQRYTAIYQEVKWSISGYDILSIWPSPFMKSPPLFFVLFCCTCTSPFETVLITHTTVKLCRCAHLRRVEGAGGGGREGLRMQMWESKKKGMQEAAGATKQRWKALPMRRWGVPLNPNPLYKLPPLNHTRSGSDIYFFFFLFNHQRRAFESIFSIAWGSPSHLWYEKDYTSVLMRTRTYAIYVCVCESTFDTMLASLSQVSLNPPPHTPLFILALEGAQSHTGWTLRAELHN